MAEEEKNNSELKDINDLKRDVEEFDEKFDSEVKMKDLSAEEAFEAERASVDYNAKNLQVLEGMEAVRRRPGMYIGSTSSVGLHHLVWEIVDNAVDEALAGFAKTIYVQINKDGSVTVEDDGRGIPVDTVESTGVSGVETVYTVLHAGGKFGEGGGYKMAGGLHGVGATVVNALSKFVNIDVYKDGKEYNIKFVNGGNVEHHLIEVGPTEKRGTRVTFAPDPEIFTETTYFKYENIRDRCRQMAYLNKAVRFVSSDLRNDDDIQRDEFYFEGGIEEYIRFIDGNKDQLFVRDKKEEYPLPVFYFTGGEEIIVPGSDKTEKIFADIAFEWRDVTPTNIYSYCNNISTTDGGTHEVGFKNAISKVLNDYWDEFIKKDRPQNFKIEDCIEGITAIISVKHPNPQYEGQTKGKLGNTNIRPVVYKIVKDHFYEFLTENKKIAEVVCTKVLEAEKVRLKTEAAKNSARQSNKFSTLAGKLSNCSSKNSAECELFIVEGNSAAGTAKDGRNAKIQAVLPLRGKILNTQKANEARIFENAEIGNMIQAIGAGYQDTFDVSKIRYDKVIIMTDADVDGSHIRILLLTFFFNYMRDLIKYGHVYAARPPLYRISYQKKMYYCYSDEELEYMKKKLGLTNSNYGLQRYKGLGEMDKDQLAETTMNPEGRTLYRITMDDAIEADRIFNELMGVDVEPRKEYISKNAQFVKDLDI